jgi:hypothetical protein
MKPALILAFTLTLVPGACMAGQGRLAQDKFDRTQSTAQADLPAPCSAGDVRTYRPTPKTDRPTYDSAIPPTSDISTRSPSECRRGR